VAATGVELECIVSATIDDTTRPLAVCAHGFPDTAHTWRYLMPSLEASGWRVVAPHLRGYAPSGIPADGCVQTGASALDLIAVHDAFEGDQRAVVIGHDWGAVIAYGAASYAPDRWSKVVSMAVPPGHALPMAFLNNPEQLRRSWYMFFFQHALADLVVPADDLAFIDTIWADWSPGYDATVDLEWVKQALRAPENLAAALGYYRASLSGIGVRADLAEVQNATTAVPARPTLYLHGATDGCVGPEVAESARGMVGANVAIEILDGCGHFLHLEAPDRVNQRIGAFLQ
jgi:pimeloyl-ACP methyl ester carboxylesterase